jgi:hypothetical protein
VRRAKGRTKVVDFLGTYLMEGHGAGALAALFLELKNPEPWISRAVARLTLGATSRPALKLLAIHLFPLGGTPFPYAASDTQPLPT